MYPARYWQKFIDQWFGSKYLLKDFLGCGAYGAVFRADEMLAHRVMQSVAVKIVIADMERLDEQLAELQLSVRLRHPHLINGITCEQGDLGGDLCLGLVMELADHSLESYCQSHPQGLSVETVKTIATHLAQGLAAIHKEGIVHRDLKPANVLLVGDLWKLADFGIARSLDGKTSTQTNASQQIGSMSYMPPEAYSGKISSAWDLWSLGIMIHELATGRHPFPTQLAPELMRMVLTEDPQIDTSLTSPLQEVIAGCLVSESKQRWREDQVLDALNPKPSPSIIQYPIPSISIKDLETITENLGRGITLELIKLPAGSFLMGSPDSDPDAYKDEKPRHLVKIKAFAIGKYPITQAQYEALTGKKPSKFTGNPNNPVEYVTWHDTQEFCQKLSRFTWYQKQYRLPSEAEWEYACRAETSTRYYFGDDSSQLGNYAWFDKNSGRQTQPVGKKKPNPWGLYDMHGNVWEWCQDRWHKNYNGAPTDGTAWIQSNDRSRILKGGCWCLNSRSCRSASHHGVNPSNGFDQYGFRIVLELR
jgi:formylglycine-generating enzyme required for sulfatase activity